MESVILVDEEDVEVGVEEKLTAHRRGLLHRAFSVFLFNSQGELLLQQRALQKYHSGGLWSNTCCSHPRPSEKTHAAANRRLDEELGIVCQLQKVFSFIYRAQMNGVVEHEYDHVFVGNYDGRVSPNPDEVRDYRWENMIDLKKKIIETPREFTPWLKIALPRVARFREQGESHSG